MASKQIYMLFLLLACSAGLTASDESEQKENSGGRDKSRNRNKSFLLAAHGSKSLPFAIVDMQRKEISHTDAAVQEAGNSLRVHSDKSAVLSALESSEPVEISAVCSSFRNKEQRHEITTPKGIIVLVGSIGICRQDAKVAIQSSSDGQYVFVESGQSPIRVFALSPKPNTVDTTFVYSSTLPVLNPVDTSGEDDGKR